MKALKAGKAGENLSAFPAFFIRSIFINGIQ
jgi:hypothetical protein